MRSDRALIGRDRDLAAITSVVDRAEAGRSGVLVITGPAGIGKTTLIERAVERASDRGVRVQRMVAAESEFAFPYAGLHQLVGPLLEFAGVLPAPQRDALAVAFGESSGPSPAPFLVALAVLGLLTEAAATRPLVCVIDDAHWLDPASSLALTFAARRLQAESVVVLFGSRTAGNEIARLPTLELAGLTDDDAATLLGRGHPVPIDASVRSQLLAEARGNPLALLELPHALSLAGGFALAKAQPLQRRVEDSLLARLDPLPAASRALLLLAAADPTGDPGLLWAACQGAGVGFDALAPVEAVDALAVDTRVRFRHPLVRSAVYRAATAEERRAAHAALAAATDRDDDPDRRAWHEAHARSTPDEAVAADLERSAGRARARGGVAAAAAFLERASMLTADDRRRAVRTLGAAQGMFDAGAFEEARRLCQSLSVADLPPREALLAERLVLEVEFALRRDPATLAPGLVDVARRLDAIDVVTARETYLRAIMVGHFLGESANPDGAPRTLLTSLSASVYEAVRSVLEQPDPAPADMLLAGEALLGTGDREQAHTVLRSALARALAQPPAPADLAWLGLACHAANDIRDPDRKREAAQRALELGRRSGDVATMPLFGAFLCAANLTLGRLRDAADDADEIDLYRELTGNPFPPYHHALLAAWRDDRTGVEQSTAELTRAAVRSEGTSDQVLHYARAIFANGRGDFAAAIAAGSRGRPRAGDGGFSTQILGELVEAATHAGDVALARDALAQFESITASIDSDWARGQLTAARAHVLDGEAAEHAHREAIDRLERGRLESFAARARLSYGERLRRERRLVEAREQLRAAHHALTALGVHGFAARAARELEAAGEATRPRTARPGTALTAQEARVARFARDGLTNREIAARLFLSDRTVEYHLRKVFVKLGISSRRELDAALETRA